MAFTRKKERKPYQNYNFNDQELKRTLVQKNGRSKSVVFVDELIEEKNKRQLDPREVTLSNLISTGIRINPDYVRNLFNITDPADLELHNEIQNQKVLNFIRENKNILSHES